MPKAALTSRSRHHFTLFDQVDRLVGASEATPDLAFMHRMMALCSLPRTDPGDAKEFTRVNGPVALGMIAGLHNKPALRQHSPAVVRLGMHGSHAETKPRVAVGRFAF